MTLSIVGAGLAGLLAGNMLAHRKPSVFERQPALPNNHSAVLRFRTSVIGDVLNIPFKKVTMIKTHVEWRNLVADALAYSKKNTGIMRSDRSIVSGATTAERYIAPPDLIGIMALRLSSPIYFNHNFDFTLPSENNWSPIISTAPMPILMQTLKYPLMDKILFGFNNGTNIRAKIEGCDAYVSLLIPNPKLPYSRLSITKDELILEVPSKIGSDLMTNLCVSSACSLLGIEENKISDIQLIPQRYAKINAIDDDARKDFIYWATDNFGIFSLGRFATWRPGLLLDDLVKDIRIIDKWLDKKDRYSIARSR